jgi:hypothetical protein
LESVSGQRSFFGVSRLHNLKPQQSAARIVEVSTIFEAAGLLHILQQGTQKSL